MTSCRWTFYDPKTLVTYVFAVNPNAGGSPVRKKNVQTQATTAPRGITLYFEGADEPLSFEWSGTINDQAHLQAYKDWFDKRHQILLTDDLGRQFYIYITSFDPKRVRSYQHRWKHTYTAKATALDWS